MSEGFSLRETLPKQGTFTSVEAQWWRLGELGRLPKGEVFAFTQTGYQGSPTPRADGEANTITCKRSQRGYVFDGRMTRLLDPVELERLQGFPDNYTSDLGTTRRVKVLGNAFCVPVIRHILEFLYVHMDVDKTKKKIRRRSAKHQRLTGEQRAI